MLDTFKNKTIIMYSNAEYRVLSKTIKGYRKEVF